MRGDLRDARTPGCEQRRDRGEENRRATKTLVAESRSDGDRIMPRRVRSSVLKRLLSEGVVAETDERPDPALDDERRRYYRLTELGARWRSPR